MEAKHPCLAKAIPTFCDTYKNIEAAPCEHGAASMLDKTIGTADAALFGIRGVRCYPMVEKARMKWRSLCPDGFMTMEMMSNRTSSWIWCSSTNLFARRM